MHIIMNEITNYEIIKLRDGLIPEQIPSPFDIYTACKQDDNIENIALWLAGRHVGKDDQLLYSGICDDLSNVKEVILSGLLNESTLKDVSIINKAYNELSQYIRKE
ncbi:MAG: hypothetical protein NVSMB46_02410 [Candidatus Saccharimonadales bacterium]